MAGVSVFVESRVLRPQQCRTSLKGSGLGTPSAKQSSRLNRRLLEKLTQSIQLATDIALLFISYDSALIPSEGMLLQFTRGSEPVGRPFLNRLVVGSEFIEVALFEDRLESYHVREIGFELGVVACVWSISPLLALSG